MRAFHEHMNVKLPSRHMVMMSRRVSIRVTPSFGDGFPPGTALFLPIGRDGQNLQGRALFCTPRHEKSWYERLVQDERIRDRLVKALLESRGPDGGWGWHGKRQSFVQPTALAELALRAHGRWSDDLGRLDFLSRCQLESGLWGAFEGDDAGSWMTSFALLAQASRRPPSPSLDRGRRALLSWTHGYGDRLTKDFLNSARQVYHLDFRLQGWPWFDATSTWVEPTAWALVALRAAGTPPSEARCLEGLRYLMDRSCRGGGWNYGNPHVLGKDLEALPLSTAAALIALAPLGHDPAVARSLEEGTAFLLASPRSRASLRATAWSLIALALAKIEGPRLAPLRRCWMERLEADEEEERGPLVWALSLLAMASLEGRNPLAP